MISVKHVAERDSGQFECRINQILRQINEAGRSILKIDYRIDAEISWGRFTVLVQYSGEEINFI